MIMVARIDLPEDDVIDLLNRVFSERRAYKKFYENIKNDYIAQNTLYEQAKGCPSLIHPLNLSSYTNSADETEKRKKSLINLYSPQPDKLPYNELEKIRKYNKLVSCPMCGEPGRPRTLDHYLPKIVYPELAINLLNLVPCCDWCQGEKKVEYSNNLGKRRYIHPYFDEVNFPLFKLVFSEPYLTPVIDIQIYQNLDEDIKALVETHLDGINFLERFSAIFETSYCSILRMAKESQVPDATSLSQSLSSALNLAKDKGINSWDAVLYRSVLEDPDLMNFLQNSTLPNYL